MLEGGEAVDFRVVLLVRGEADLGGDTELVGHVEAVEPAVECVLGASDADLDSRAVVVFPGGIGGEGLLAGLDGESGFLGIALDVLLEAGLDVLICGGLRLVRGEPFHFPGHLFAALLEVLRSGELVLGELRLCVHADSHGFGEVEREEVENHESDDGEEGDEFFFSV